MSEETPSQSEPGSEPPEDRPRRWPILASGIAVVAVAALTVSVLSGGFAAEKDDKVLIPGTDLPPLDPDMRYSFEDLEDGDSSEPSETSRAYGEAFWAYLDERFPGYQNHAIVEPEYAESGEIDGEVMLGDEVDGAELVRTMSGLAEWRYDNKEKTSSTFERNTGYKRPYFQFSGTAANNLPDYTQFPDREFADGLSLRIYPAGSFASGTSCDAALSGVQLLDCCDWEESDGVEQQCDTHTADNGDEVMTSRLREMTEAEDGEQVTYSQTNTVALIRESDGVGIMVSDESPVNRHVEDAGDGPPPLDDPEDATPALDLDDLTELAQALPELPVK